MYCDLIICFLFTNNSLNTTTRHSSTADAVVVVAIFAECAISLAIPEESGICANNVLPRYLLYRFTCQDRTPTGSLLPCSLYFSVLSTVRPFSALTSQGSWDLKCDVVVTNSTHSRRSGAHMTSKDAKSSHVCHPPLVLAVVRL